MGSNYEGGGLCPIAKSGRFNCWKPPFLSSSLMCIDYRIDPQSIHVD